MGEQASAPNTVHVSKLSQIAMVNGNEKLYETVIDEGILKDWVGIGWVDIRQATDEDRAKYPTVVRD